MVDGTVRSGVGGFGGTNGTSCISVLMIGGEISGGCDCELKSMAWVMP